MSENEEKPAGLKDLSLKPGPKPSALDLKSMNMSELLALRDQIDSFLPSTSIKDFDLERELIHQFYKAKELQTNAATDVGTPTNQRAQVANTVAKLLSDLISLQTQIYNAEQFRRMEAALGKTLKAMPKETQEAFFGLYEKTAQEMADAGPQTPS